MKYERVYHTDDEYDYPDDPKVIKEATGVLIFSIIGGPCLLIMIMLLVIHADTIEIWMNNITTGAISFLFNSPKTTGFIISLLFTGAFYLAVRFVKKRIG